MTLLERLNDGLFAEILEEVPENTADLGPGFARGVALVMSDRFEEAVAQAERLQKGMHARHPCIIAAQALAQAGDVDGAMTWAMAGLHRRLSTDHVDLFASTPGLAELDDEVQALIRGACTVLVGHGMPRMRAQGLMEGDIRLVTGATVPTLQQAYQILNDCEGAGGPSTSLGTLALQVALARCERWYDDFDDARAALERARALKVEAPFLDAEALFLTRDEILLRATRVQLTGYSASFVRFRTDVSIGAEYDGMSQTEDLSSMTPEAIAVRFKDELVALIDSGFEFTVLEMVDGETVPTIELPSSEDKVPALEALLSGPLTWSNWQEIVGAFGALPVGAVKEEAALAVSEYLAIQPAAAPSGEVVGLWRLSTVSCQVGELDYEGADFSDIEDLKSRSDYNEWQWSAEGSARLVTLLEVRPGRFRGVDLSRYPIIRKTVDDDSKPVLEESTEQVGMVSEYMGYEFSYETRDAEGFQKIYEEGIVDGCSAVVLCSTDEDQRLEDRIEVADGKLKRSAWLLWDGLYVTLHELVYERVSIVN